MSKIKWFFVILAGLLVTFMTFTSCYYQAVGPFKIYEVDISQKTEDFNFQTYLTADINKVDKSLYIADLSDNSRIFQLKDGKVRVLYGDQEFMRSFSKDSDKDVFDTWKHLSKDFMEYALNEGIMTYRGSEIADDVIDYRVDTDGHLHYLVQTSQYEYVNFSSGHRVTFPSSGTYRDMEIGDNVLCVVEQHNIAPTLNVVDMQSGELVYSKRGGSRPVISQDSAWYIIGDHVFEYNVNTHEENNVFIDEVRELAVFDEEYVYYLCRNNDVGRINVKTKEIEIILESNLDDPIIRFCVGFLG